MSHYGLPIFARRFRAALAMRGESAANLRWIGGCLFSVSLLFGVNASEGSRPAVDPLFSSVVQSNLASSTQLVGLARAGQRLVAVGWRGHIVYSDNQGRTWQQAEVPVGADLTAVNFPTADSGWAVGHGGVILRSRDGGKTWVKQQDGFSTSKLMTSYYQKRLDQAPEAEQAQAASLLEQVRLNYETGPEQPWLDVWFENDQHGYVVGTFNLIMETRDGGEHWTPLLDRMDNPDGLHLSAINAVGHELYIASERGTVFRLDKDSQRFVALNSGYIGSFFGVTGDARAVVAYGLRGNAWRSLDKGVSWEKISTGTEATLTGGTILDHGRLALVSQGGSLLLGDAAAGALEPIKLLHSAPFANIEPAAADSVVIVGTQGAQLEPLPASGS
ncbi:YCF48-related protein [Pseudomonas sp. PDM31]|uniref:YCF48-related protein n=1 Tax=Pseudomonas sp. PDM31 TaxID=2854778 RepID=UPI001C4574C5|nr:YCF48-related protein [Pseudomonas sp. PDM31]MBV7477533.1 glycosyl hydrolase [Pseudomonas sp. PDM31]